MIFGFLFKHRLVIIYGLSLAVLLLLLRLLEWHFLILRNTLEVYTGLTAVLFTALGIWLALKLSKPKTITIERQVAIDNRTFVFNEGELNKLGISRRELEVLQLIAEGLSNQEIAGRLFVSLNTIKTHSSKVFEKLDVQRRTQAVEKAKRLGLIP